MKPREHVPVLDFGSQYTQLIARSIRELGVYSEILPYHTPPAELRSNAKGIVLSGGPASVYDADPPLPGSTILELGIPVLGICYGMQVIAHLSGGRVVRGVKREYGEAKLLVDDSSDLFEGTEREMAVWMSHGDGLEELPREFVSIAHTENSPYAAIRHSGKRIYGLQFHPEVVHTKEGKTLFRNFLYGICGCRGEWEMGEFIEATVRELRRQVGEERVICGLSGGVDSAVTALLVHKAVGDNLTAILVDNGLLRAGEVEEVKRVFEENFGMNLRVLDAKERFLAKLSGVLDPEEKRRAVGEEFIRVFEEEGEAIGGVGWLAQGTLYPDRIESSSVVGPSAVIKTHHNVGGLPEAIKFKLIEPLKELFKDEVREIGRMLGLPDEIVERHPFPGPGLAVRLVGEVTEKRLAVLRACDSIVREEIERAGLYEDVWQAFGILLPVRSVGVMGDLRTYENVLVLRVVTSRDGMTADWAKLPYPVLGRISNRVINEIEGVNRVTYDISSKPPATIEWE